MDVAAWGGVGPPRLTGWKAHLAHQRGRGGDLAANLGGQVRLEQRAGTSSFLRGAVGDAEGVTASVLPLQMQLPLPPRVEVDRALRERR